MCKVGNLIWQKEGMPCLVVKAKNDLSKLPWNLASNNKQNRADQVEIIHSLSFEGWYTIRLHAKHTDRLLRGEENWKFDDESKRFYVDHLLWLTCISAF